MRETVLDREMCSMVDAEESRPMKTIMLGGGRRREIAAAD